MRNARFSDFSPSSSKNVVETERGISNIVSAQEGTNTALLNGLFATIFCCSQHKEIFTNFVSTSPGEMPFFRISRQVRRTTSLKRKRVSTILFERRRLSRLVFEADCLLRFSVVHNTSKYWRTLSARHLAKCPFFAFFTKFVEQRRWNEKEYRRYCFSAKGYRNCFFKRTVCYDFLLFTTHWNIDELCQHNYRWCLRLFAADCRICLLFAKKTTGLFLEFLSVFILFFIFFYHTQHLALRYRQTETKTLVK